MKKSEKQGKKENTKKMNGEARGEVTKHAKKAFVKKMKSIIRFEDTTGKYCVKARETRVI